MVSRRAFLGTAAAAVATSGCAGTADALLGVGPVVRVAVSWSAAELKAFRSVLDALNLEYRVELVPLGDDIASAFASHIARGPDVVLLPQPGLVLQRHGELVDLRGITDQQWPYAEVWSRMLCLGDKCYGLPFKIAHKSTVWYRRSVFEQAGLTVPERWSDWLKLNNDILSNDRLVRQRISPLALPAADGWMLTDFFENVLLGLAPKAYDRLALPGGNARLSEEGAVRSALSLVGQMWAQASLPGEVNRALVQQFSDAVVEVFGHRRAAMVVAPDFAEPLVRSVTGDDPDFGIFRFPRIDAAPPIADSIPEESERRPPLLAGGDVIVLRTEFNEHARDLVRRLADPRAPLPWITDPGGFLAANTNTPLDSYSTALRGLAKDLVDERQSIRFDLSDQLRALGGRDGLWRVLQDFLVQVAGRGAEADLSGAVNRAIRALHEFEE
ncbi:MAG: ABC transporter substrate-binding protein [Pseudonocardiaceae bacterium]